MIIQHDTWRPLFVREPAEQRAWDVVTRGVRDYLIRIAEADGRLLKRCANPFALAEMISARAYELELVQSAITTLLHDGFLRWEGTPESPGWLGIDRLVTFGAHEFGAQESGDDAAAAPADESPVERRRRLARDRKQRSRDKVRDTPRDTQPETGVTEERDQRPLPPQSPPSERETNKNSESAPANVQRDKVRDTPRDVRRVTDDPGARGHLRLEPQLDHRKFAEKNGIDLDALVRKVLADPRSTQLSTVSFWDLLTKMLDKAADRQQRLGGAA